MSQSNAICFGVMWIIGFEMGVWSKSTLSWIDKVFSSFFTYPGIFQSRNCIAPIYKRFCSASQNRGEDTMRVIATTQTEVHKILTFQINVVAKISVPYGVNSKDAPLSVDTRFTVAVIDSSVFEATKSTATLCPLFSIPASKSRIQESFYSAKVFFLKCGTDAHKAISYSERASEFIIIYHAMSYATNTNVWYHHHI